MLFCPNFSNKQIKKQFDRLKKLFGEDIAYFLWNKNNGYNLDRYPDGQPSQLYQTVLSNTGSEDAAINAVAANLSEDSEFMFSRKPTSEAKYNYNRSIQDTREERIAELKSYYYKAYDFSSKLEQFKQETLNIKNMLTRTFKDEETTDTEEDKLDKVEKYKKSLYTEKNPYVKFIGSRRNSDGSITVYVNTYSAKELLQRRLDDYFNSMSDDQILSELQNFEVDELSLEMYHINPRRVPELKQQIASKNSTLSKDDIDLAIQFLIDLENNQENNAYVECCLRWLKNGTISLPRDNEKIRQAFDLARQKGIDIQRCKSPIDIYIQAQKTPSVVRKTTPVDISRVREFIFAEKRTIKGKEVYIYNVEDSVEGATAVAQLLSDTGIYDEDKQRSVPFSPWCLAQYKVNEEGKVTLEEGSRTRWWPKYNKIQRQIAICDGRPIAFNASSYKDVQWWDFHDHDHDTLEDVDINTSEVVYNNKMINNGDTEYISIGSFHYGYKGSGIVSISDSFIAKGLPGFYISNVSSDIKYRFGEDSINIDTMESLNSYRILIYIGSYPNPSHEIHIVRDKNDRIKTGGETRKTTRSGVEVNPIQFDTSREMESKIIKLFDLVASRAGNFNISLQDVDNKQIRKLVEDVFQYYKNKVENFQEDTSEQPANAPSPVEVQPEPIAPRTEAGQEALTHIINRNAEQAFNEPIHAVPRRVVNGIDNQYDTPDERVVSRARHRIINGVSLYGEYTSDEQQEDNSNYDWITEDLRKDIEEKDRRKTLVDLYEKYFAQPVNDELSKKLFDILKKYKFEIIETSLKEAFGDDVLGAYDVLQKIIYLTNHKDRNAITDAEEFSHAFFKMMGAVYRKNLEKYPHARLYHELRDLVEKTQLYLDTYEEYKNDPQYKYNNGGVNLPKIKEEALGKALAAALNNRYEVDHSFYKKMLRWFNNAIDWFKSIFGDKSTTLEKELDKIAKDILNDNYGKYLDVMKHSNWNQVTWRETIDKDIKENNGFGVNLMRFASRLGGYISGSTAVRAQGYLYRPEVESLHDIDIAFPLSIHKLHTHADFENHHWESQELLDLIYQSEGSSEIINQFLQQYPNMRPISAFASNNNVIVNFMICDDVSLYERFKEMEGNFNSRLAQFTEEEREQIHLIDLFFNENNTISKKAFITDGISLSNYRASFIEKLGYSRPKDLIDYQLWQPFEREYKIDTESAIFYSLGQQESENESEVVGEEFSVEQARIIDKDLDDYLLHQSIEESQITGVVKTVQTNGKIRLSLSSHTEQNPRQIVLEPQPGNKFYVHQRIWDGEKVPGKITAEDKLKLFDALYEELPDGAKILLPESKEGYYATRGAIAGLLKLSKDSRFEKGTPGTVLYEDRDGSIKTFDGTSFIKKPSSTKTVDQATMEWAQQRQREILGETQLQLAEAFGLTRQEDGTWTTTDTSAEGQLRVQFVNDMLNPGSIDFDGDSVNAHTVISIGLNQADASTFNHELAHYYIRKFWNSKAVQDALDMVYVKEMGDYKNDPKARKAVEEALADYMTQRTIDSQFLTNIESQSYYQKFWEAFNKMLYKVFDIKTNTAKNAILKQIIKSFLVNEKLEVSAKRPKYAMHVGTMYQTELQRRKMRTSGRVMYRALDREEFEETVEKIVSAIQSKAKSYQIHSLGAQNSVYGDEQQMAFNQESVRVVKQFARTVEQLQAANDAAAILSEKVKLFMDFLQRADQEANRVLRLLKNARANDKYKRVAYTTDQYGNKHYDNQSNAPFVATQSTGQITVREFTWDDLVYAKNDIIDFFKEVVDNVQTIAGRAVEYGIDNVAAQQILDFINTTNLYQNIEEIERLYIESRKIKVKQWIDKTIEERVELDDDFKNRLRINMYKWLDSQMDFGDVSVWERWTGMASMSKSPIIRAVQDEISRIQSERDELVHKKALELRAQLAKARKQMGLKYRILPFNVQKLLVQLDKHGLPTGNFISEYNDGLYKQELENYKNLILFGKHGIEKEIKDSGLMPKDWKLMVDQKGEPIFPDDPRLYQYEKEYHLLVEEFKGDREIRKFTKQYYIDRVHMLSIPALRALNAIQEKINDITEAITIDGKPKLNLLTEDQQDLLVSLYRQLNQLGSMTNIDGTEKVPGTEEYEIAQSIKSWRLHTQGKIEYAADYVAYKEAYDKAVDKAAFSRRFSSYQVNPLIWRELRRRGIYFPESDSDTQTLNSAKYDRSKLVKPYKGYQIGQVDWDSLFDETTGTIKNEEFFKKLGELDALISNKQKILKERYKSPIKRKPEPKIMNQLDIPVHLVPGVTSWLTAQSQYDYMVQKINIAIQNDPTLTDAEKIDKRRYYKELLTYYDANEEERVPLSIFSEYLPVNSSVTQIGNQKYASYVITPVSIFQKVVGGIYTDPRYDQAKQGIQLTEQYKDKRYEKYFSGNSQLSKLLEDLKATSQECFDMIPFLQRNDNRLPQIGGRSGQILGRRFSTRWWNPAVFGHNFLHWLSREWEVYETDTSFLQVEEREVRPDGSKIQSIPIRFLKRLDDPEYISMDVVGSMIMFYNMATNYKLKSQNANKLTSILDQLEAGDQKQKSKLMQKFTTSQAQVLRDIYGRQLYEDQNESTNDKENFIDTEWKHFDWVRQHVISNPATLVKRVRKSRAAFQLGLLALNASSAVISFLDPLISLAIDSVTGKYINYKDIFYAAYKMTPVQGNLYGSVLSLGSARTHSKIAAAMQKLQLGKANVESFKDLDQSQIMRFLSDGLTMKYFTLGDYTINTINMVATMHNYKYYKKQDGTAGFYPKHIFLRMVMDDKNCSLKEAKKQYNSAVCMWQSCKVDEIGDFVPADNEYGDAITKETWNDVRAQIRQRSSMYNGIVPDLEKSLMQTSVYTSFMTMVRNFIITGIWERFQSYRDFQVASLDESGEPVDRQSSKEEIIEAKRSQRYYKGGYNFATRQIEDGVDISFAYWLTHMAPYLKYAMFMLTHSNARSKYSEAHKQKLKESNLAQTDIYGVQKIFMEFIIVSIFLLLSSVTNKVAEDDKDSYWKQMLNLITLRLAIERTVWMNPTTIMDLISSPTAALSDWRRKLKIFDLFYDSVGLSDYKLHDEVKRGRYAEAERWKYNLFNAMSSFGLNNWYADMPEELGGGGAKSVNEKTNFYRGLVRAIPVAGRLFLNQKQKESSKKKGQKKVYSN